jgi:hypothetical protein
MIGVIKQTNPQILTVLESASEVLARVQDEFHTMVRARNQERLQEIQISCFFEELPLPVIGVVSYSTHSNGYFANTQIQVVPKDSAILPGYIPIGIHSNHMGMTRFDDKDDAGFKAITRELRRWIKGLTMPPSS